MGNESSLGFFGLMYWLHHEGGGITVALALLLMLAAAAAAYFLGCFNGAVIVSKYILRDDVRKHTLEIGRAGLTNFYRTFGGPLTVVVILTDVLKAVAAVLVGMVLFRVIGTQAMETAGKYWAGTFCLLGHMFPCMFKFKGGKGILSGGTIALMVDWRIALVYAAVGRRLRRAGGMEAPGQPEAHPGWNGVQIQFSSQEGRGAETMKIAVMGSGGWGTALAMVLLENGHDVTLWSYTQE